jgi:hypothetical protein
MAAGDIHQITDVQVLHGQGLANVWYQEVVDDTGSTDPIVDAANAFAADVIATLVEAQSIELNHDCILIRRVFPTTSPVEVVDVSNLGARLVPSLPSNQAVTLRKYSGTGGPNNRNRSFIAGIPESDMDRGRVTEAASGNWANVLAKIVADYVDSGRTYKIKTFSKKFGTWADCDAAELNPRLTKLRGRTPGICIIS